MLEIRKLKDSDIAPLAKIESESFSMPWKEQDFRELLELSYARYLVALWDGEVVGSAGMRLVGTEGDIDNVVVAPAMRGRGIATQLIEKLLVWGEEEGIAEFTLEVRVSNAPAIKVYESNGFESVGVRPHFYSNPTEDALIMWRR